MKMRSAIASVLALAVGLLIAPLRSLATETQTFMLELEVPNTASAPNGDPVAITGEGEFSVFPNSIEAEGGFVHSNSAGTPRGHQHVDRHVAPELSVVWLRCPFRGPDP
jgi:hypothetical protein